MKVLAAATLALALTGMQAAAYGQNKRAADCQRQAGDPANPTYEAVYRNCMGGKAAPAARKPAPKTAAAKPAKPAAKAANRQEACRRQAGDNEAIFKDCMGAAAGGTKKR